MFELFLISVIVLVMSFVSDQSIPGDIIDKSTYACIDRKGVKSLQASSVFGKAHFSVTCKDGIQISNLSAVSIGNDKSKSN